MPATRLYPALINWPFFVGSILLSFGLQQKIAGLPLGLLMVFLVISYEGIRTPRIIGQLESEVTLAQIQQYYAKDRAHKWIPWRDQACGINSESQTKNSSERI